jgi:pyrrolidone-carboxylate peptidase
MTTLVTGFEPFGRFKVNSSELVDCDQDLRQKLK